MTIDHTLQHREQLLGKARALVDAAKSQNRDLSTAENDQVHATLAEVRQLNARAAADAASKKILSSLDQMAKGGDVEGPGGGDTRRLAFTKSMAAGLAEKMLGDGLHQKALSPSGAVTIGQEFTTSPVTLGQPANTLLSVMPIKQHDSPEFAYLRQSVRSNAAAVVAEGAVKPTSTYSVVRVQDSLKVIAHLSEGVPRYWFLDNADLQAFLVSELQYGLAVAVEAAALATINAASGVIIQAYSTSVLATLRKSLTALASQGYEAGFMLVNPADWEGVELALATTNAVEYQGLPYDASARRLFGVPVVVSNAQAVGVSHTVGIAAVALDTDGRGVSVQWSESSNADDFSKNLIRARCEGRFATSVFQPAAIVKGDLTA